VDGKRTHPGARLDCRIKATELPSNRRQAEWAKAFDRPNPKRSVVGCVAAWSAHADEAPPAERQGPRNPVTRAERGKPLETSVSIADKVARKGH
jgi:hypothetical protein